MTARQRPFAQIAEYRGLGRRSVRENGLPASGKHVLNHVSNSDVVNAIYTTVGNWSTKLLQASF